MTWNDWKCLLVLFALQVTWVQAVEDELPHQLQELKIIREEQVLNIDSKYVKALERVKVEYSKSGDLESALVAKKIHDEFTESIRNRRNGGSIAAKKKEEASGAEENLPERVAALNEIRDEQILGLDEKYLRAINSAKLAYTKAGDLDSAALAKEISEKLTESIASRKDLESEESNENTQPQVASAEQASEDGDAENDIDKRIFQEWKQLDTPGGIIVFPDGRARYIWKGSPAQTGLWTYSDKVLTILWNNGGSSVLDLTDFDGTEVKGRKARFIPAK